MNRIVFLPVDERFCTRGYFILSCEALNIEILTPPKDLLGKKKVSPDMEVLLSWLEENIQPADLLVISIDMLVYGGLIPSRIGVEQYKTLERRLELLRGFKKRGTKIYATSAITRLPFYNSSEEEPDYWAYFGEEIYRLSKKYTIDEQGQSFREFLNSQATQLHAWIIDDICERRERNFKIIKKSLDLLSQGTIDFYNLVLDDNSENSLSIFEAAKHEKLIKEKGLMDTVSIHPGADEASLTLLSRAVSDYFQYSPKFKINYMNPQYKTFVPPYEGSPFDESLKNHIYAAGGTIVTEDEDILLFANNPVNKLNSEQQSKSNLGDYSLLDRLDSTHSIISYSDPKYVNGADNGFVEKILERKIDWKYANYSGWNTSGNTIGTSCALSVLQHFGKKKQLSINEKAINRLMAIFLLEHWGFQANIRGELLKEMKKRGINGWTVIPHEIWAQRYVEKELDAYLRRINPNNRLGLNQLKVFFPWHRSFELGIDFFKNQTE